MGRMEQAQGNQQGGCAEAIRRAPRGGKLFSAIPNVGPSSQTQMLEKDASSSDALAAIKGESSIYYTHNPANFVAAKP
jgi:hypothetical protein